MEQRTEEWFKARLGKVTSSKVADILARTKSGYSASRENYLYQLLTEELTGTPADSYISKPMEWGMDNEVHARAMYEITTGELVKEVGFVDHPTIPRFGASPDGLVGVDGLLEIKCPDTKKHLYTIETRNIDRQYQIQMTAQMMCSMRKWCDFVSYDPRLPVKLCMVVIRYPFDMDLAILIGQEVNLFLLELRALIDKWGQA